jgi:hypothetical protein
VYEGNPARRLYERMGFCYYGEQQHLSSKRESIYLRFLCKKEYEPKRID